MLLRRSSFWWGWALAAGSLLLAYLGFVLLITQPFQRMVLADIAAPLIDLLAVGGLLRAAWVLHNRDNPFERRMAMVWMVLGLAQLYTALGDLVWMLYESIFHIPASPSIADVLYLLFYPTFLLGLILIPTRQRSKHEWIKVGIDMGIVVLVALLVGGNYILGAQAQGQQVSPLLMMINLSYPVGDLALLVALLFALSYLSGIRWRAPMLILAVGLLFIVIFDLLYGMDWTRNPYQTGNLVDLPYVFGNFLIGLGGIVQAEWKLKDKAEPAEDAESKEPIWLSYLPYFWVLAAYILLVSGDMRFLPMQPIMVEMIVGLVMCLVVLRQVLEMYENRELSSHLQRALTQLGDQAVTLEQTNQEMQAEILERRRVEERLMHDALHDALTGLPNRTLFLDRLGQAARKKKRSPAFTYVVLFLDLDSFKVVNDSLGHITGDRLLMRIANILSACVRGSDTVARLGGDEFVILLEDLSSPEVATNTADRMQRELNKPMQLEGVRVFVSVSIGIVENVDSYEHPEDVLRDADLAMYQAKSRGKARYEIFNSSMRASAISRMLLENDMRRALESHEFVLHYQPILTLPEKRLDGFEALVRWQHPDRGLIQPLEFIPLAEETGLILPLGKWILSAACHQAYEWQMRFPEAPGMKVNVNISGRQIKQPDFVLMVAQVLQDSHLDPRRLVLEVTETVCLDNLATVVATLEALQRLGVETQIDDFGTGYSSLSYLQRLPIHSIKIDRSFIHTIDSKTGSAPDMVRAIFSMVNNLGIKAVAEGIETLPQLEELTRLHCDYVQGYLLAHPMDSLNLEKWLLDNPASPCS